MKASLHYALIAMLCIAGIQLNAQTFTWGDALPSLNEVENTSTNLVDAKFYRIYSKYTMSMFNRDVKVTPFALNTLKPGETIDLTEQSPKPGKGALGHLSMYQVNGPDYVVFLDDYDSKSKLNQLYTLTVNIDTGVKSTPVVVTDMPGRSSTYDIQQSPNKQFYAVIKSHSRDKKVNEKINIVLLDKNFKLIKETTYSTQYLNKLPGLDTFCVSDNGSVYIVKEIDIAKQKPFKTLLFWDGKSDTMTETSLKFDNDYQIYAFKGHFSGNDFYLHGLYTRIGSKGVQMYGGSVPAAGVYAAKFTATGEKAYIEANDTGEIPGLHLKDFVFDGMKTWLFADNLFTFKNLKPTPPGGTPSSEYDYSYSNDQIVFGKIDNETGKLEWHKKIAYDEAKTLNDNGTYLSYLYFLKDNQLSILYNDTQKTKVDGRNIDERFTVMEIFDDRGNPVSKTFLADTGLEPQSYHENFDLDTSVQTVVKDGVYIVRAKSRNGNEKYGYFKF